MAQSSILGGNAAPAKPRGTGTDLLGPSDSSDSGSDVQGERRFATSPDEGSEGAIPVELDSDTDAAGTGERGSAVPENERDGGDILPDRVFDPSADAPDDTLVPDDDELIGADDLADETDPPDTEDPVETPAAPRARRR